MKKKYAGKMNGINEECPLRVWYEGGRMKASAGEFHFYTSVEMEFNEEKFFEVCSAIRDGMTDGHHLNAFLTSEHQKFSDYWQEMTDIRPTTMRGPVTTINPYRQR